MANVDLEHAQADLERLLKRALGGEDVIITHGRDAFRLTLVPANDAEPPRAMRCPGRLKHAIGPIAAGAFAPMSEDEVTEWEQGAVFPTGAQ